MRAFIQLAALCGLFVNLRALQPDCPAGPVDIAFVIDGSKNVGTANFQTSLDGAVEVTKLIEVGATELKSRVGMVVFHGMSQLEFRLMNTTNSDVENAIHGVKFPNLDGVDIASGMDIATRKIFNRAYPLERKATKYMIIITSNNDKSDVRAERSLANEIGVIPIAIGIGSGAVKSKIAVPILGASRDQLLIATGDAANVYMISDYSQLLDTLKKIFCDIISPINPPVAPPTTVPPTTKDSGSGGVVTDKDHPTPVSTEDPSITPTKDSGSGGNSTVDTPKPSPIPTIPPTDIKTSRGCDCDYHKTWLDLIFLLDSSKAVNEYDFYAVRNFAASFINQIPVSQQQGAFSRVGIINMAANEANVIGDLHSYHDTASAYKAMRTTPYIGKEGVNLKTGLVAAQDMIDNAKERPNVQKVVIVFTQKSEDCSYQNLIQLKTKMLRGESIDDNPCRIAARLTTGGHIVMTVGLVFDGVNRFPVLELGSHCFHYNFNVAFTRNFLDAMCKANCYCLPPYEQYKHDDSCVEYGECVYVQGQPVDHWTAEATCTDIHASLVDIYSEDKENFLRAIQAPHHISGSWLSLKAKNGELQWHGEKLNSKDYTNWAPSEPQLSKGECAAMKSSGLWAMEKCDSLYDSEYFMCQMRSCDALHYCTFKTFTPTKMMN